MANTTMMFPNTVMEFMEQYKMVDTEHIYSNGIEYVPIFRMEQWFAHQADTSRWIPVTERLPQESGIYLVSGKWANKDSEVWICEFVRLHHVWGWCKEASRPVIQAWMPLHEPYKGGEEE